MVCFIFIGDPPIFVTIWNVVFANKSWKLGWIWMKLGRWGLRSEKTKPCTFQMKLCYGFWKESEKIGRRGVVFLSCVRHTISAAFLRSISAKLHTNTCSDGGS